MCPKKSEQGGKHESDSCSRMNVVVETRAKVLLAQGYFHWPNQNKIRRNELMSEAKAMPTRSHVKYNFYDCNTFDQVNITRGHTLLLLLLLLLLLNGHNKKDGLKLSSESVNNIYLQSFVYSVL